MRKKVLSVVASRLLRYGAEISTHVSIDLPSLTLGTADVSGAGLMGTLQIPTTGNFDSMDFGIKVQGLDDDTYDLIALGAHEFELRFAQDCYSVQTGMVPEGAKIFVSSIFKSSDGGTVEGRNPIESTVKYEVMRYEVIISGKRKLLIDKPNFVYEVKGKNYMKNVYDMLY